MKPDILSWQNTIGFEASQSLRNFGNDGNDRVKSRLEKHSNSFMKENESEIDNFRGELNELQIDNQESLSPGLRRRTVNG